MYKNGKMMVSNFTIGLFDKADMGYGDGYRALGSNSLISVVAGIGSKAKKVQSAAR